MEPAYDAVLIVAFGGPERKEDVIPFLENVLRGRNVPRERVLEVAEHYDHFDGVSPINSQVRELIDALGKALHRQGVDLPIYWGNRNWHPLLKDTIAQMADDGIKRAVGVVLAAYSSYATCRQYREDIQRAQRAVGESAPQVEKLRVFYNHPDFIAANIQRVAAAIQQCPEARRNELHIAYTAHSIPCSMARSCDYETQLQETCRLISERLGVGPQRWRLVYQSRSGHPNDSWLQPDICDHLAELQKQGGCDVVVMPVGFLSDHVEVLYDLDKEAYSVCEKLGLNMLRAATVGTHPLFVRMLCELIQERLQGSSERLATGRFGPSPDVCPEDCCPAHIRPPGARSQ